MLYKKFMDTRHYSVGKITVKILILNTIWFGVFFVSRFMLAGVYGEDVQGFALIVAPFTFPILVVVLCICVVETRLINSDRRRFWGIIGNIGLYSKPFCFVLFLLVAFLTSDNRLAECIMISMLYFAVAIMYTVAYYKYKDNHEYIVIDLLDCYRIGGRRNSGE